MNQPLERAATGAPTTAGAKPPRRRRSPAREAWRRIEHWIVVAHRWIGILTCVLVAVWCFSGIAIMYVIAPKLTEIERHAGLTPIAWSQVRVDPTAALHAAGQTRFPQVMTLEMQGPRPVYRFTDWKGAPHAVSAVDGRPIAAVSRADALAIARGFAHSDRPTYERLVASDRWTFKASFDKSRPFHLIALNDPAGREVYVSARTGAIAMEIDRADHLLEAVGRTPHILEWSWMRDHPVAYRQLMLWLTGGGAVLALSGLVLGFIRLSLVKRYAGGKVSPFRGWMEWHHLLGVVGGITLFVWIATAWVYMKPFHSFPEDGPKKADLQRYAGHASADFPLGAAGLARLAPRGAGIAGVTWLDGKPAAWFVDARGRFVGDDVGTGAGPGRLSDARLVAAARHLMPGAPVVRYAYRDTPDVYWHTFKGNYRRLPVFRVVFGDRDHTWVHLDPYSGEVLGTATDSDRGYYMWFDQIHKVDLMWFPEPWRKLVLWVLMLCGGAISVTGAVVGWKYLTRPRRKRRAPAAQVAR